MNRVINKEISVDDKFTVCIEYNVDGKQNLSLVGQKYRKDICIGGGQCQESLLKIKKPFGAYTLKDIRKLYDIWNKHHLNDMHPGCIHQDAWGTDKKIVVYRYGFGNAYMKKKNNLREVCITDPKKAQEDALILKNVDTWFKKGLQDRKENLPPEMQELLDKGYLSLNKKEEETAGWVHYETHSEGLLCKPCEVCGYKYGSGWLRRDVPLEVIKFLDSL